MSGRSGMVRVVEREARIFRHLWRGPVILSVVTPVLFLAGMGIGLGGLVDDGDTAGVGGLTYLQFVAPGLLVANAMQVAAGESLWPVMGGKKWMRTYHAMVATPLDASDVLAGHIAWTAIRTAMSGTAFLLVAALLGAIPSWWAPLALPAAVLCAAVFAALVASFAVGQESDIPFTPVMRLGVIPLFLFSGTFFPVEQLPDRVEPVVALSPLWHGVELARGATTGSLDPLAGLAHLAALLGLLALGWRWGSRRFTRELQA